MNCIHHSTESAQTICTACGSALCAACTQTIDNGKKVCGDKCAAIMQRQDQATLEILNKAKVHAAFTSLYLILMGILFVLSSALILSEKPQAFWRLSLFLVAMGLASIFVGVYYRRLSKANQ